MLPQIFGPVVSGQTSTSEVRVRFSGGQNIQKIVNSDIFLLVIYLKLTKYKNLL